MKTHATVSVAAILITTFMGCSTPQATTRGQNHNVQVLPPANQNVNRIQNAVSDAHVFPTQASYHSTTGFPGYGGFSGCPQGNCQVGHYGGCPNGHCGHGCGCGHQCPHHRFSWSYERPQNLKYPDAGAVGGAVVYPYYTHKGPSDFFLDDCSVLCN